VNLTTGKNVTLQSIQEAVFFDPFNSLDYKMSYLVNTASLSVTPAQSREYLSSLENKQVLGDAGYYLAYYYLAKKTPDIEKGLAVAEDYIHQRRIDPASWDQIFSLYESYLNTPLSKTVKNDKVYESAARLCIYLSEINASLPKPVKPALANYIYMQTASAAKYKSKQHLVDTRINCDLDSNGISDLIVSQTAGSVEWGFNLIVQPNEVYSLKIYTDSSSICDVIFDGKKYSCTYDAKNSCFVATLISADKKVKNLTVRTNNYTQNTYLTLETSAT
jgi:hypothetical protein